MKATKKKINTYKHIKHTKKIKIYNNKGGGKITMTYFNYNKHADNTINNVSNRNRCMCLDYDKDNNNNFILKTGNESRCNNIAEPGKNFCKKHKHCKNFLASYTTGYEPDYKPSLWSHPYVEGSHNCYSYFLDDRNDSIKNKCKELCLKNHKNGCPKKISECGNLKSQPGDFGMLLKQGNLQGKSRDYSCPLLENKILSDNPTIRKSKLTEKCPNKYYKGAVVVDPNHTFHFYRQNKDSTWSHKPGTLPVTQYDADKQFIYVPHYANRNYTKDRGKNEKPINYTDFCGYYCIPNNTYLNTNMA